MRNMGFEKINLKVGGGGSGSPWFATRCITHAQIIQWIKDKGHDADTTSSLVKMSKGFPSGMLHVFKKNFHTYLTKARGK